MKKALFTLLVSASLTNSFAQNNQTHLKQNAVKIDQLDVLDNPIYQKVKGFKLFMIGEMHGTNEPVKFLIGLTELFTKYNDTVQVGFEIPSDQMDVFKNMQTHKSIYVSDFFLNKSVDGRTSVAWANAISRLSKNPKVQIFFFDINREESKNPLKRDSLMYTKIKNRIIKHPNWRTVTISGNIHNMRLKFNNSPTAANYLCNDKDLDLSDKICTINHQYLTGAMFNNIGSGLELRQVSSKPSVYSQVLKFDDYLYLFSTANSYNGILFTKNVSASKLATEQ